MSMEEHWENAKKYCKASFAGGYEGKEYKAFQHGIETAFNSIVSGTRYTHLSDLTKVKEPGRR